MSVARKRRQWFVLGAREEGKRFGIQRLNRLTVLHTKRCCLVTARGEQRPRIRQHASHRIYERFTPNHSNKCCWRARPKASVSSGSCSPEIVAPSWSRQRDVVS